MSSDADLLADRRSLRRKLTLWRLLAVVGVIAAAVVAGLAWTGRGPGPISQAHIARVTISGFISGDRRTLEPLLPLPNNVLPLALSPDGRQLAVSVESRHVQIWDIPALREELTSLGLNW